jgi:hypothetical protein
MILVNGVYSLVLSSSAKNIMFVLLEYSTSNFFYQIAIIKWNWIRHNILFCLNIYLESRSLKASNT